MLVKRGEIWYILLIILLDQLREAKNALKDAHKRIGDLEALKSQLEAEREHLASALSDTEDALKEMEQKYTQAHDSLVRLKSEMEQRLREKDDELDTLR